MDRLHLGESEELEATLNRLLRELALLCLDSARPRPVAIDYMDNSYHGEEYEDPGELCSMKARDGTTTFHRYCTASVISASKPLSIAFTEVRGDESRCPTIDRVLRSRLQ